MQVEIDLVEQVKVFFLDKTAGLLTMPHRYYSLAQ